MTYLSSLLQNNEHRKIRLVTSAILMFLVLVSGRVAYEKYLIATLGADVERGLEEELDHLAEEGNAVAQNTILKEALIAQDYVKALAALSAEKNKRKIGLMSLANSEGIIVARTLSANRTGDNILMLSPQGRALQSGQSLVASIEVSFFNPIQVVMTTGRRVFADNEVIGYLFANFLLDDAYAQRFRDTFLSRGWPQPEVAFYTRENGVYGTSFEEENMRDLVRVYYVDHGVWLREHPEGERVTLGNRTYLVVDLPYKGLEGEDTGTLLFIPRISTIFLLGITLVCMLLALPLVHIKFQV